jgi:predicted O-linked N-acetylglucosamine transferase (SPINDLY family)
MSFDDLFAAAVQAEQAGRLDEAEQCCRSILAGAPQHAGALLVAGIVSSKKGDLATAQSLLQQSLAIAPDAATAHWVLASVFAALERGAEALAHFERAATLDPNLAEAHYQAGQLLFGANRLDEALAAFDRAIAARPGFIEARGAKAVVLARLVRYDAALAELDALLGAAPDYSWALAMRGKVHLECRRYDPALADCSRAIALDGNLDGLVNRARAYRELKRLNEAKADIDRAMAMNSNYPYALLVRAALLVDLRRPADALVDYRRVLAMRPDDAAAYTGLGGALLALGRTDEALAAYNRAIALDGNFAHAYFGRGDVWRQLAREERAIADFERAAMLDPALTMDRSQRLHLAGQICDWSDRDAQIADLIARVNKGEPVFPGVLLANIDDPQIHLAAARRMAVPAAADPVRRRTAKHERLRIAYLSPDFCEHVLSVQIIELIEKHDRTRFEVFGISLIDWPSSGTLDRLARGFEHFVSAGSLDDRGVAELLASLEIDIAVDLAGHTDRQRMKVFSYRPAPVAVNYLGYPGTTGSEYIDYVLADAVAIPPDADATYSEAVARLPDCFFPADSGIPLLETGTRVEAGLPKTGFVFCGFNNTTKLSPEVFAVWMRLLGAVDGSVLWLNIASEAAQANLRAEAQKGGVPPERIVFAPRVRMRLDHFARLRFADLHLDSLPYNAHSTASDSLLTGVPLLTCQGRAFAGRVAASMLTTLGLPELIAHDLAEYERIALELARSPEKMAAIRARLGRARKTSPMFDMTRLARQIEGAYEIMWQRHLDGDAPQSFTVPRI